MEWRKKDEETEEEDEMEEEEWWNRMKRGEKSGEVEEERGMEGRSNLFQSVCYEIRTPAQSR